jgi:hypothetical protein
MIVTDTFARFGRRMSSTQGCPYVTIAETPNPIRQLDPAALRVRAEAMLATVVDGLTLPADELERRLRRDAADAAHPPLAERAGLAAAFVLIGMFAPTSVQLF